jgi:hypothetical protein
MKKIRLRSKLSPLNCGSGCAGSLRNELHMRSPNSFLSKPVQSALAEHKIPLTLEPGQYKPPLSGLKFQGYPFL